jgi:hypothetical protein
MTTKVHKLPVPTRRGADITKFDPTKAFEIDVKSKALIECSQKVRDWNTLDVAVDTHVENLVELVAWWNQTVRSQGEARKENPDLHFLSVADAEGLSRFKQPKISKFKRNLRDIPGFKIDLRGPSYRVGLDEKDRRADLQTGEMEWYTPSTYIEKARRVLGRIDIDPASCEAAQTVVNASHFFTVGCSQTENSRSGGVRGMVGRERSEEGLEEGAGEEVNNNPDRHYYSVKAAQTLTGIKQPTVSKWGKRLEKKDPLSCLKAIPASALPTNGAKTSALRRCDVQKRIFLPQKA